MFFRNYIIIYVLSICLNPQSVLSDDNKTAVVWFPDLSCHPFYSERSFNRMEREQRPGVRLRGEGGWLVRSISKECPSFYQVDPCLKLCTLISWTDPYPLAPNGTVDEEFIGKLLGTNSFDGRLEVGLHRVMNDVSYTINLVKMMRDTCTQLPLGNLCEEKQSELVDCIEGFLNCSRLQGLWIMDGKFSDVNLTNREMSLAVKKGHKYFDLSCHDGYKNSPQTHKQRPRRIEDQCVRYFKDENEMCIKGCIAWDMFQEVGDLSSLESLAKYVPGFEKPNMKLANYMWNNCSGYYDKDIQPYTCPEKAEHWENFSNCISDVWACRQPAHPKKQ